MYTDEKSITETATQNKGVGEYRLIRDPKWGCGWVPLDAEP